MQITMTRFSGKTLTANRNVDALRLRGSQGTPAGTFELYVMSDLSDQSEQKYSQRNFMSDQGVFDALVASGVDVQLGMDMPPIFLPVCLVPLLYPNQ